MSSINITHSFSGTTNRRIGGGLIALGLLLWLFLPYSILKKHQFLNGAASTTAQVIENDGAPQIQFRTLEGITVVTVLDGWRSGDIVKGDEVEIEYSLVDPTLVESKDSLWTGQVVIASLALVSCFFGAAVRKGILVVGPLKQSGFNIG